MALQLTVGEPEAGPWQAVDLRTLLRWVLGAAGEAGRPRIVAVDGRSGSGKSTLADRLAGEVQGSEVVHADDLAWHEPLFGWGRLLREDVLPPLHRGEDVRLRPPAWERRGREGLIAVSAAAPLVVIEGCGAAQREVHELLDTVVWVQSDFAEAERRGIARDIEQGVNGDPEETVAFWHDWMAPELEYFAHDRPWERAGIVVAGTSVIPLGHGEVAVAPGFRAQIDCSTQA